MKFIYIINIISYIMENKNQYFIVFDTETNGLPIQVPSK